MRALGRGGGVLGRDRVGRVRRGRKMEEGREKESRPGARRDGVEEGGIREGGNASQSVPRRRPPVPVTLTCVDLNLFLNLFLS